MNSLFIISLFLGCFLATINGLRCPSCTYLTTTADIPAIVRTVIDGALSLFQDAECSKALSGPKPEVREEVCPVEPGKVSKCSFYTGSLTLKVPVIGTEIPFQMYQRGCYSSLSANVPANGCYDRDHVNEDKSYFDKILDSAGGLVSGLDAVDFKGNMCLCSDTYCATSGSANVKGLQCPSCTYLTTTADIPSIVRTIIDGALSLFQDSECSKKLSGPIPEVKEESCPVESGKVSKCSFYTGSLTLKVPIIGTEIPFKMYQRGCYSSLSANVPANGCYDRDHVNEDKSYFDKILDSAGGVVSSLDAVDFKGSMCLCSDTYCTTSGSAHLTAKCRLLFISSLLIMIVLRLL